MPLEKTSVTDASVQTRTQYRAVIKSLIILFSLIFIISFPRIRESHSIKDYDKLLKLSRDPVGDPIGKPTLDPSSDHLYTGKHGMVSSDVQLCSQLGRNILQRGGNAADASITVALCIGSVNLHSSGIGGGAFILSSSIAKNEVLSIDAREIAPMAAHRDMFNKRPILSKVGGLAIAVPGELKGLFELYCRHSSGNLTWYELIEPVIELNRAGFKCPLYLSRAISLIAEQVFPLVPQLREPWDFIFKREEQKFIPISEGEHIRREALADTLELIARNDSADIFYDPDGPIAGYLVNASTRFGGILTKQDFANYKVNVEEALHLNFSVDDTPYLAYSSGGASSGLALLSGLNLYESLDSQPQKTSPQLDTHKIIECMKWMASVRSNFGDFSISGSNNTIQENLRNKFLSKEWANDIIESKNYSANRTFNWKHYQPKYELTEPHGTSHFSIVDAHGNAVAMTTTVNLFFGSMVYDNTTGIILNNEMDDFSIPNVPNAFNLTPSVYNYIQPAKRPISSTSPTIIMARVNGTFLPDLVIGAAGGSRITTAVFHAIVRMLFQNYTLLDTIAFPRIHHQLIPEAIMVEDMVTFEKELNATDFLKLRGHDFINTGPLTAMNAVKRVLGDMEEVWHGVSDFWRKSGEASGY